MSDEQKNDLMEEDNDGLIELTDETTGESILFEHLDTIEYEGTAYFVLTEYFEEEPEESDVYIMTVIGGEDGEETLEIVEDEDIITAVYEQFQERCGDDFEFLE